VSDMSGGGVFPVGTFLQTAIGGDGLGLQASAPCGISANRRMMENVALGVKRGGEHFQPGQT